MGVRRRYRPAGRREGRGKIERLFRTVNGEFTVEIAAGEGKPGRRVAGLAEMNRLFTAWVENVYHRRTHSGTGMAPLARWMTGAPFPVPSATDLAEAFRWAGYRTVSKTGLVSLHSNRYQVDPSLAGRKVELVFDPFDLSFLRVRSDGHDAGTALPFQISRHSTPRPGPKSRPNRLSPPPASTTSP